MLYYSAKPVRRIEGTIRVPGDKSISHRSIIFGSLATGETEVSGFLEGEDSLRTLSAFQAMGVPIEHAGGGSVRVTGRGLNGLTAPTIDLDLGNSGTAMRLMAGVLAGQSFASTLCGDASLSARPMGRVIKPLKQMGASISGNENDQPPLKINGSPLKGIEYRSPVASAQIKSCVLLAGLQAQGTTRVIEPGVTRDHTERMLTGFGYSIEREGMSVAIEGGGSLQGTRVDVPSDISSAAFWLVAASIADSADLTLLHVGVNPTRTGILDILTLMGADITRSNEREVGGEPVADLRVKSAQLKGIEVPEALVPLAIDEFPILFVAAACASGETLVTGAEELRVKESDRIQVMVDGLKALGCNIEGTPDGAIIQGGELHGGEVDSHGDHRTAMAFSIASLRSSKAIRVADCDNVNTSFPGFVDLANSVGMDIQTESSTNV